MYPTELDPVSIFSKLEKVFLTITRSDVLLYVHELRWIDLWEPVKLQYTYKGLNFCPFCPPPPILVCRTSTVKGSKKVYGGKSIRTRPLGYKRKDPNSTTSKSDLYAGKEETITSSEGRSMNLGDTRPPVDPCRGGWWGGDEESVHRHWCLLFLIGRGGLRGWGWWPQGVGATSDACVLSRFPLV